jgi:hypothetical protein
MKKTRKNQEKTGRKEVDEKKPTEHTWVEYGTR